MAEKSGQTPVRHAVRRAANLLAAVLLATVLFGAGLISGRVGPPEWGWVRVTFMLLASFTLFVVA